MRAVSARKIGLRLSLRTPHFSPQMPRPKIACQSHFSEPERQKQPQCNEHEQWTLKPSPNFDFFINRCYYSTYDEAIFGKLADKGLSGCTSVVGADGQKWCRFGGDLFATSGPSRLVGPVQEISDRFETSMLNWANDECETGQAHYGIESLARCVAIRELADMLYRLECIGTEGELEAAKVFFTDIQVEFEKLKSFLPQPNWMQTAKQQKMRRRK